jgi:hypothetical protein
MSASVTTSGDNYTMTISDSTQDWTQTTTLSSEGANASAEAVAEAPCCNAAGNPLPLADTTARVGGRGHRRPGLETGHRGDVGRAAVCLSGCHGYDFDLPAGVR